MSGLIVSSSSAEGMCVTVPVGGPKFFCDNYIRKNIPIYLPPNSNINTVISMDQKVQSIVNGANTYSECTWPFFNFECAPSFQPCINNTTPTQAGVCLSACEQASSCSPGKIQGDCKKWGWEQIRLGGGGSYCLEYNWIDVTPSPISSSVCDNRNFVTPDETNGEIYCAGHIAPPQPSQNSGTISTTARYALITAIALPIITHLLL